MGLNFIEFLIEAKRILKNNGTLIIAEIISRIVSIQKFIHILKQLGFELTKQKNIKGYFILMVFKKANSTKNNKEIKNYNSIGSDILKPCFYKKR